MSDTRVKRRNRRETMRRGFYVIPSLFTVANMFCGFLSIIESTRGHFERSAVLLLLAIFADVLDGRIARLTGTATAFGEAYDSLADVVSFGVAPALLAYQWGLSEVHRVGMAVVFLFLVAGSIRLARFNAKSHDSLDFIGLPIPAGAGSIAMLVLMSPTPVTHPAFIPVVAAFVLALSLLMVSNLPYKSFKGVNLRRKWPAPTLFLIALVFSLVTLTPHVLSVLAAIYVLSAPVTILTRRVRRHPDTEVHEIHEEATDVAENTSP
ncbi:MAG: CDP-diacylglycerol--serine O-phosphatidyltransferase [Thermoanaerobaculales bacterium]|nr:CDP-diacylglycerol--serine O-phosphatidyltransferase [Thermoanaerobaculales bacterium]